MYVLVLNDMRMAQVEMSRPVVRSESREALEAFLLREQVEPYRDGQWGKTYRQGGPLEWFNPPSEMFRQGIVDAGTLQQRIDNVIRDTTDWWNHQILSIPAVEVH